MLEVRHVKDGFEVSEVKGKQVKNPPDSRSCRSLEAVQWVSLPGGPHSHKGDAIEKVMADYNIGSLLPRHQVAGSLTTSPARTRSGVVVMLANDVVLPDYWKAA